MGDFGGLELCDIDHRGGLLRAASGFGILNTCVTDPSSEAVRFTSVMGKLENWQTAYMSIRYTWTGSIRLPIAPVPSSLLATLREICFPCALIVNLSGGPGQSLPFLRQLRHVGHVSSCAMLV